MLNSIQLNEYGYKTEKGFKDTETMAQGERWKKKIEFREFNGRWYLKIEDLNERLLNTTHNILSRLVY